jgi:phosphatidylinositol alpha-1,6-mannosyltransferase
MGERGRALVRARYAWDAIARQMAERYREAARRRRWVVLTPGMTGADGVSELTRLAVRALSPVSGVEVLSVGDRRGSPAGTPGARLEAAGGSKWRFAALALAARLRRPRPAGVLCVHLHLSPLAWLLAGGRRRLATVLVGIEAWKPLGLLHGLALGRSDALLAISEQTARRFGAANPRFAGPPPRVCHLALREPAPAAPEPVAVESPFALIVGRMALAERYKGHDLLLDLWPRLLEEVPEARLVVAGDGDDRARLDARARALDGHVRFVGRVSAAALGALYRDCAFFVMPSRDEGFGLVYLEAMRAGKACVGGQGSAAELIEDGVTGLTVDPEDPEQVLKALLRLFREPETCERMGRAGRERVARLFGEAAFGRRFRALLGFQEDLP